MGKVFSMQNTMNKKRAHQRLHELFSGIEPLVVNPAGNKSEIRHEPENLPSPIADLEKPVLEYENSAVDVEANLSVNPLVNNQQHSDGLILYEQGQIGVAYSNDKLENRHDPTSSLLPNLPNVITSPLKVGGQAIGDMQIESQPDMQWTADELSVTHWQAMGIGTAAGIIITGLVFAFTFQMDLFDNLGRLALIVGEILFGIIGALVSKSSGKTGRAMWIASIVWALVPVVAALIFILLLALIMLTNFSGV